MEFQAAIHLGAHLGLADWIEIAFEVPMSAQRYAAAYGSVLSDETLMPTGFYAADARTNVPPPDAAPVDPRVAVKLRVPRRLGPLGLAMVLAATLPFGDDSAFLGDTGFTFRPMAI